MVEQFGTRSSVVLTPNGRGIEEKHGHLSYLCLDGRNGNKTGSYFG